MKELTIVDRDRVVRGLEEEWDTLIALAAELSPDDWAQPTDCPGWSVKDNYAHIIGTESTLLGRATPEVEVPDDVDYIRNEIGRINEPWVRSYRDRSGAEVVSDLAEVVTERRAALALMDQAAFDEPSWTPAGDDTYGRFMQIRVMDQWFHEQDVREATGRPGHLEGTAPEVVLAEIGMSLGYVVGKKAAAPKGSTVRLDLRGDLAAVYELEVADRANLVPELEGEPTVTLALPGTAFCRLVGGRRASDDPAVREGVEVTGDQALGERILSNLKFMV